MSWRIGISREAEKFLAHNRIEQGEISALMRLALKKFAGQVVNIDIKKLKGAWRGFHRIRRGDLRIIASFNFDQPSVFIEVIDWRGNAYKA